MPQNNNKLSESSIEKIQQDGDKAETILREDFLNTLDSLTNAILARTEYLSALSSEPSIDPLWQAIWIAIVGGLSGAFAAYLFTSIHSRSTRKKENRVQIASNLNKQILSLEEKSVSYWLSSFDDDTESLQDSAELQIKSLLTVLRHLSRAMQPHIIKKNDEGLLNDIRRFNDEMYDVITGGGFESNGREPSKNKAAHISKMCGVMRSKIYELEYSII